MSRVLDWKEITAQKQLQPFSGPSPSNINRVDLNLPNSRIFLLDGFLSPEECDHYTKETKNFGYEGLGREFQADYRNNERCACKSKLVASLMYERAKDFLKQSDIENVRPYGFGTEGVWKPTSCDEWFKFSKYHPGTFFKPHLDSPYVVNDDARSIFTLMIFLNDDFEGGQTNFLPLNNNSLQDEQTQPWTLALREGSKEGLLFLARKMPLVDWVKYSVKFWHINPFEVCLTGKDPSECLKTLFAVLGEKNSTMLINVSCPPHYRTALHCATEKNDLISVEILLKKGADTRALSLPLQQTPLHISTRKQFSSITQLLIQYDDQLPAYHEIKDRDLITPSQFAEQNSSDVLAQAIIKKNALKPTHPIYKEKNEKNQKRRQQPPANPVRVIYPSGTISLDVKENIFSSAKNADPSSILYSVTPKKGRAIIFNHDCLHEGSPVLKGIKYVMRTEIVFERIHSSDQRWKKDPTFLHCVQLYNAAEVLEKQGKVDQSCSMQLEALKLQANQNSSIPKDTQYKDFLPLDGWRLVFLNLSLWSLHQFMSVNKQWLHISRNEKSWRDLYIKDFHESFHLESTLSEKAFMKDWYNIYKKRLLLTKRGSTMVLDFDENYFYGTWTGKSFVWESEPHVLTINYGAHNSVPTKGSDDEFIIGRGHCPFENGRIGDQYLLEGMIRTFVKKFSQADDSRVLDRYFMIVEPDFGWFKDDKRILKTILRDLKVPGVAFADRAVLSLAAVEKKTGLVIHIGEKYCIVSSVFEGVRSEKRRIEHQESHVATTAVVEFLKTFDEKRQDELGRNYVIVLRTNKRSTFVSAIQHAMKTLNEKYVGLSLQDVSGSAWYPVYGGYITACLSNFPSSIEQVLEPSIKQVLKSVPLISLITPTNCLALKIGGYAILNGYPCKITTITKKGKQGYSQLRFSGVDIFNDTKHEMLCTPTCDVDIPLVTIEEFQLLDIDYNGAVRWSVVDIGCELFDSSGVNLPDECDSDRELATALSKAFKEGAEGNIYITILSALNRRAIKGWRIGK